jgi:very-short-patch-repair endonuclease
MPLTQYAVTGADGQEYRVDFCWPSSRVIVEVDGLAKYGDTPHEVRVNKKRELERQRALEAEGWTVIRWTWDDLVRDPWALIRNLRPLLHAAA